jgi:recombination protein RecR
MQYSSRLVESLIEELGRLPGIGRKTAQRLAFHLLKASKEEALRLSEAVRAVKEKVSNCTVCGNITEQDPCLICADPRRDRDVICVVESPVDVVAGAVGRLPRAVPCAGRALAAGRRGAR